MDAVTVRSILLRLVIVIGVVAGLLAMHTLITGPQHTATATAVTVEHHLADAGGAPSESSISDDCGSSGCLPVHAFGVMTCLLALLVVWALAGAAPPSDRRMSGVQPVVRMLAAKPRSLSPPSPSLVALSISRT